MGTGDLCQMPLAAVHHGKAQRKDLVEIVEGSSGVPGPRGQYSEKVLSIEKPEVLDVCVCVCVWGGCNVAKCSSDSRVAYPDVKFQVRDLVRVVGIVAPFAPWEFDTWENSFYRAPGGKRAQETCAGCPKQRCATGEPGKVQGMDHVGIVEGSCGYRARGVSIREKFVLSRNLGYGGFPLSLEVKYWTMVARQCL